VALVVFTLMMADFFDTMGTVIGVGEQAGFVDERGPPARHPQRAVVDSLGAVTGGAFGVSSNTTYIESAAGVAEGGRTGLTSVVVGVLFLARHPHRADRRHRAGAGHRAGARRRRLPDVHHRARLRLGSGAGRGYGSGRGRGARHACSGHGEPVDSRIDVVFPVLATLIVMPLTFTITDGIAAGFVTYVFLKLVTGRAREVHPLMWAADRLRDLLRMAPWIEVLIG
jgi:adenine/guanine/hypoxanthine permease